MEAQPDFVVEGERVALGPLRMDLIPLYQCWENDLEVANGNGRVIPATLEGQREYVAGRTGKPDLIDFTVYARADQAPIGWSSLFRIDHRYGTADFGILLGRATRPGLGDRGDPAHARLGIHHAWPAQHHARSGLMERAGHPGLCQGRLSGIGAPSRCGRDHGPPPRRGVHGPARHGVPAS